VLRSLRWSLDPTVTLLFLITGEEGHQDGAVEGVRVHPLLVLRVPDARARPATHDRRTLVRCQDPQQQGGTGLLLCVITYLRT
jgi:hypothetical protein